jgi:putative adenylate-forming enzyme
MFKPGSVLDEIRRGNIDVESFCFPLFYANCRIRFKAMSGAEIARYQTDKARSIARYAARHAPYFAQLYREHDLNQVWSLPTTNKKAMMDNLTKTNTVGLTRQEILAFCEHVERTRGFSLRLKGINIGMSSGTSGNRGVEITTRREEHYSRAAFFARFPFPRAKINMAFILRVSSPAFRLDLFGHHLTYISQLNTREAILQQLERLDPNVLAAPPSMLRILAREVEQGRLSIAPLQLVSYAEVLTPDDRAYLQQAFNCPVYEIYKATEGAIAISCRQGSLHVNEDLVALELLDDEGLPTPPGSPSCRTIVTDLHKTSQPIIRYELNDVITISPRPCPCGSAFRVIEQIQGRSDDLFWGPRIDDGQMQFIFPDYVRRAIVLISEQILEYQVTQLAPDRVRVRLLVEDLSAQERIAEAARHAIEQVFASYACRGPRVEVEFGEPLPNPQSNKLIRVHRAFDVERYAHPDARGAL